MTSPIEQEILDAAFDHAERIAEQMLDLDDSSINSPLYRQAFAEEYQKFLKNYGLE